MYTLCYILGVKGESDGGGDAGEPNAGVVIYSSGEKE